MLECNNNHTAPAIGFLRSPGLLRKFIRRVTHWRYLPGPVAASLVRRIAETGRTVLQVPGQALQEVGL